MAQDWKRSVCIPIPKKGNTKECSNCQTIALISPARKVILKIVQAELQQYVDWELPDIHGGFRKGRETRGQIAKISWTLEKAREFQKNIYLCFTVYAKAFDCVDHNQLWKILQEMGIPEHQTYLLQNLYAGEEATVRTGRGTTDWLFPTGKGVRQGCRVSPCSFTLYADYIMRNARLDEAQAGNKIVRRNINNPDTQMTASGTKVKEESENVGLKLNIQKMKIIEASPISSWQIDGEAMETVTDFIWGWAPKITADGDCSH